MLQTIHYSSSRKVGEALHSKSNISTSHKRLRTLSVEVIVAIRALMLLTLALHNRRAATLKVGRITLATANVALRQPLGAVPGLKALFGVHLVDILEGQGLSLEQEEIRQERGSSVTAEEDVTESVADTIVGVWGQETNQEVTEPVRSSGNRGLLGPSAQLESFTDDRPGERAPSHSEGGDKHASRDNHDDAGAFVLHRRTGSRDTGEDEQPGGLPDRTNDQ